MKIVTDDYLTVLIEKRNLVESAAGEYDALDKEMKDLIKKRAGDKPAHFVINKKWEAIVKAHGKGLRVDVSKLGELTPEA